MSTAWNLHLVLDALCLPPFKPLAQAELKWVSAKTAFLLAITSAKHVGELHALSVSDSCLRWNSNGSGVTLFSGRFYHRQTSTVLFTWHKLSP